MDRAEKLDYTVRLLLAVIFIALVPMILPTEAVLWFPLYVMGGAAYFIGVTKVI